MRVNLTLSVDIETAKAVKEMQRRGIKPSHFFIDAVKKLKANDYETKPKSAI